MAGTTKSSASSSIARLELSTPTGSVMFVYHNPGRFILGLRRADQGVVSIQGDKLEFADVQGHSFSVLLTEPSYSVNGHHHLEVKLANGDRWAFLGTSDITVISDKLRPLMARFGIAPDNVVGVESRRQSVMEAAPAIGAAAVGGIATYYSSMFYGGQVLEGYAQVDTFAKALRDRGITVTVDRPNFGVWLAYLSDKPKQFNLVMTVFNPILDFIAAWFALGLTVGQATLLRNHIQLDAIVVTVLAVLVTIACGRLAMYITRPY